MEATAGLLRQFGDLVPVLEIRDRWLLSRITDGNFWNREPVNATSPFELAEDDDDDNTPLY